MKKYKFIINDGEGAATRGMRRNHTHSMTVAAKSLMGALRTIWEKVSDDYDDDLEDYDDPYEFLNDMDCSSGEPFIEEVYEDDKCVFTLFEDTE